MNPRDGSYSEWTEFSPVPRKAFRPPAYGELLDWVLVIERAAALTAFGESLETLQGEVTSNIKHDI